MFGLLGFLLLGGAMPLYVDGWWYGMTRDWSVGDRNGTFAAFFAWLLFGPVEGFLIGYFTCRWFDLRKAI